jgi:hypothetical protein
MVEAVSVDDVNLVTVHMLRSPLVAQRAVMIKLEGSDFPPSYSTWGLVWDIVKSHIEKDNTLPTDLTLTYDLAAMLNDKAISAAAHQHAMQIVTYAFSIPEEAFQPAKVLAADGPLQRLVDVFKLMPTARELSYITDVGELSGHLDAVATLRQQTRVLQSTAKPEVLSRETRAERLGLEPPEPTGVDFIDIALGGIAPATSVGVLAESSGGKTILGVQLAVESVLRGNPTMFLAYEQSINGDLSERLYRYTLNIPRKKWKEEMKEGYAGASAEFDALMDSSDKQLAQLQLFDMSGSRNGQGTGGAREIRGLLENAETEGRLPKMVVVDWLGPMVMATVGQKFDWKRFRSDSFADAIKEELNLFKMIVQEFKIKLVLLHQLAPGIIGNKSPSYIPNWSDAAECKSFGLLLNFVFTFGRMDPVTSRMWWHVPKARGSEKHKRIVVLDGENDRIVDSRGYRALDIGNERIGYFCEAKGANSEDIEGFG